MFPRAYGNVVVDTSTNFSIYNPIIIKDVVAVSSDTLHFKVGNGVDFWSDLPYNGGSQIGGYAVTTEDASDWDIIYFDVDDSTWKFTPRGIADTVTNLIANGTTVYPTFCPIVELSDSTGRPTGKIKIADGATQFASIPWTMGGIVVYGAFATGISGKSIEYNGVEWIPMEYWDKTEFPSPTPTGTKYLRDDMTWATVGIITPSSSVDGNIVIFNGTTGSDIRDSGVSTASLVTASGCPNNTFQIGTSYNGIILKHNSGELQVRNPTDTAFADAEFATIYCDFATVRNNLYIKGTHDLTTNAFGTVTLDGSIVWTQSTDGSGSGLDADLLDGHESAYFASIGAMSSYATTGHSHTTFPSLKVGDSSNYSNFATDGTFTLVGSATAWEDLRIEPVARTTGTNAPTFEQWLTDGSSSRGVYLYSFDDAAAGSEKEVHFTMQMPHAWKGSGVYLHTHWIPNSDGTSQTVKWGLEYSWAEPGTVFPSTSLIYASTNVQGDTSLVAKKHYITEFASVTPTTSQDGLSSIMIGRLWRYSSHADDTYTDKTGLLYIDAHYEVDSLGSSQVYTK